MKKNAIISLADSNYFELLNELVNSIKRFEKSKEVEICIMDAGLEKHQLEILEKKVDKIKKAEWDIEVPSFKVKGREWLKSQVSRAFLPNYFPGYEKYLWIDADAWVNSWNSIELYFKGCENKKKCCLYCALWSGQPPIGKPSESTVISGNAYLESYGSPHFGCL